MIFGFNIIQGIAEDTAAAILKAAGTEPGQYTSHPPSTTPSEICVSTAHEITIFSVLMSTRASSYAGRRQQTSNGCDLPTLTVWTKAFATICQSFSGTAAPNRCFLCGTGPCGRWYMEWRSMRNILATCSACWLIRICLPLI